MAALADERDARDQAAARPFGPHGPPDRAGLRQLRRGRLGTGVLRPGAERGPGVRADGRRLGVRPHPLRYGRRLRRRAQRAGDRPLDRLARGPPAADDQDLQPDAGRRGPRPAPRADRPPAAHEPGTARGGPGRAVPRPRVRPGRAAGGVVRRARTGPGRRHDRRLRGQQLRRRAADGGAGGGRAAGDPEQLFAADPPGRSRTCSRCARNGRSPTWRSARWPAGGSPASTAAASRSRPARG